MITPSGICLCLTAGTLEEDLRLVEKYRRHVDLLELRADFLEPAEAAGAGRLPGLVDCPVILTVRRIREGGRFAGDERDRVRLIEKLLPGGFAFLDLEEDVDPPGLAGRFTSGRTRIIRSLHDHAGMPDDLPQG